jgi:hypothetical protein
MKEELTFVYEKECWYVSAFLDDQSLDGSQKALEIVDMIRDNIDPLLASHTERLERSSEKKH